MDPISATYAVGVHVVVRCFYASVAGCLVQAADVCNGMDNDCKVTYAPKTKCNCLCVHPSYCSITCVSEACRAKADVCDVRNANSNISEELFENELNCLLLYCVQIEDFCTGTSTQCPMDIK